jgi:hypothetical protein
VKNSVLALVLFAGGCAMPQQQDHPGGGNDLATLSGVGGSGGDDLAVQDAGPPPEGADLAHEPGADLAAPAPIPDLAMPAPVPDLAKPAPIPDLATPPPPDMATLCTPNTPSSTCGLFPQCGCGPGQMCNNEDDTGKSLCSVAGTTPPFGACNPTTNGDGVCVAGTTCVQGSCVPFCNGTCSNGVCLGVTNGSGTPIPGMQVCSLNCDPLNPNTAAGSYGACGTGVSCVPRSDGNTVCVSPTKGSAKQDDVCSVDADCAPGFACKGTGYCSKYCKIGVAGQCASPLTCRAFSPKVYAGTIQFGYCY